MLTHEDRLRGIYAELVENLATAGRENEARECAQLAVRQNVWGDPSQRPRHYVASLPPIPLYDPGQFWIARYLERHWPTIRAEVDQVTDPTSQGFSPVEEPLVECGRWDQVVFYEGGERFERTCALFPRTAEVLAGIPEAERAAGVIMFSWLHPGTHIVPHCGHTNARLRIHLGIRTSPEARLRVKDQILTWKEGECLVFDDSFEHEVWHWGSEPRVVLLFDILHPTLSQMEREAVLRAQGLAREEKIRTFLKERGLRAVVRNEDGSIKVTPDVSTSLAIQRYMLDSHIRSVELAGEELTVSYESGPPLADFRPASAGTERDLRENTDLSRELPFFSSAGEAARFVRLGIDPVVEGLPAEVKYVDFGGGQGVLARAVYDHLRAAGRSVLAVVVDSNENYLRQARELGLDTVLANIEHTELAALDLATMRLVNHYANAAQQVAMARAIRRSLRPGGVLVSQIETSDPLVCDVHTAVANLESLSGVPNAGYFWHTLEGYPDLLREAGFTEARVVGSSPDIEMTVDQALGVAWKRFNARRLRDAVAAGRNNEVDDLARRRVRFFQQAKALIGTAVQRLPEGALLREGLVQLRYPILVSR